MRVYHHENPGLTAKWKQEFKDYISIADQIIFGGNLEKHVEVIHMYHRKHTSDKSLNWMLHGLSELYNAETKTVTMFAGQFSGTRGWAACHDLTHVFDMVHGNLEFNIEDKTITYLKLIYEDNVDYTKLYSVPSRLYPSYWLRGVKEYRFQDHFAPWETKAFMLADLCISEYQNALKRPNLRDEYEAK